MMNPLAPLQIKESPALVRHTLTAAGGAPGAGGAPVEYAGLYPLIAG